MADRTFSKKGWFLLGGGAQSECEVVPLARGRQPLPEMVGWDQTQTHPAILGAGPSCRSDRNSLARRDLLTRPPFGQAPLVTPPLRTPPIVRWNRTLFKNGDSRACSDIGLQATP